MAAKMWFLRKYKEYDGHRITNEAVLQETRKLLIVKRNYVEVKIFIDRKTQRILENSDRERYGRSG